jgi:hypothetical protein
MIIVKIVGGLASQLNKYAVGRALALRHGTSLKLDLDWFECTPSGDTRWPFHLDKFAIVAEAATADDVRRIRGSDLRVRAIRRINRLLRRPLLPSRVVDLGSLAPDQFLALPADVYLHGEACGDALFRSIRSRLLEEFRLRSGLSADAQRFESEIRQATYAVSIHVRRGDFISNPNAARFHELTGLDFYCEAARLVLDSRPDAQFFVFSDDVGWVTDNLLPVLPAGSVVVDGLVCHEDFSLMSHCRGNIISNSGFSWTAAWLNDAPDRIVVSPKSWLKDPALNEAVMRSMQQAGWIYL